MIIVSGGQTGVDRAAWDTALEAGLPQEGWVPRGRRASDGVLPERYRCRETESADYAVRTERNVILGDATLILAFGSPKGGTLLTIDLCRRHKRPHLLLDLDRIPEEEAVRTASGFLKEQHPERLNIAGPRERAGKRIYPRARNFLTALFTRPV